MIEGADNESFGTQGITLADEGDASKTFIIDP
jgi:hypothetical protein